MMVITCKDRPSQRQPPQPNSPNHLPRLLLLEWEMYFVEKDLSQKAFLPKKILYFCRILSQKRKWWSQKRIFLKEKKRKSLTTLTERKDCVPKERKWWSQKKNFPHRKEKKISDSAHCTADKWKPYYSLLLLQVSSIYYLFTFKYIKENLWRGLKY